MFAELFMNGTCKMCVIQTLARNESKQIPFTNFFFVFLFDFVAMAMGFCGNRLKKGFVR